MALDYKFLLIQEISSVDGIVVGVLKYDERYTEYPYPPNQIKVDIDIDDSNLLGYKYDSTAEETTEIKTAASFTAPSSGKYFDEYGVEQDIS